jgi:hypothetical protein
LLLGNLLAFGLLASALFLAGETYYRFIYDTSDSIDYTLVSQRWFRQYYVENSAGFRDNLQYAREIEPGQRRISFIGDSFTAGHGVKSVEDRFPNLIRLRHPEWEIHVLARLGLDTGGELELLQKSLRDGYQLDQVVLVYCLNDVADLFPEWRKALEDFVARAKSRPWLWRHSYLLDTLYFRFAVSRNAYLGRYYSFVSAGYRGPLWERQKQRLTEFRDLVRNGGGQLRVIVFPFLNSLGPQYEFQFAHDELNAFWDELKVPHLDLLPVYSHLPPDRITVSRYDAHPNEYAHELAAQKIEEFLRAQLTGAAGHGPQRP